MAIGTGIIRGSEIVTEVGGAKPYRLNSSAVRSLAGAGATGAFRLSSLRGKSSWSPTWNTINKSWVTTNSSSTQPNYADNNAIAMPRNINVRVTMTAIDGDAGLSVAMIKGGSVQATAAVSTLGGTTVDYYQGRVIYFNAGETLAFRGYVSGWTASTGNSPVSSYKTSTIQVHDNDSGALIATWQLIGQHTDSVGRGGGGGPITVE